LQNSEAKREEKKKKETGGFGPPQYLLALSFLA
jgi:hypothetical protein